MAFNHQRRMAEALLRAEKKLEAVKKICYSRRAPANEKIADIIHILEAEE